MKSTLTKESKRTDHSKGHVLVAAVLLAAWSVVVMHWQAEEIGRIARDNAAAAADRLILMTRIAAFVIGIFVFILGVWTWRIGQRACRAEQFSVIESQVIRRKHTIEGRKARIIGRVSQIAGVVFLLLGTASAWLLVELAELTLPK